MKKKYETFSWMTKEQISKFAKDHETRGYKLHKVIYCGIDARNSTFSGQIVLVKLSIIERIVKWAKSLWSNNEKI